ncbi:unnamed protein product [marine sediment metagenome]|uniref:Uncharacterized protein n=1 Tax=marine sediment metagenome TaxID=412755 RepID=X0T245_9ZZZZ
MKAWRRQTVVYRSPDLGGEPGENDLGSLIVTVEVPVSLSCPVDVSLKIAETEVVISNVIHEFLQRAGDLAKDFEERPTARIRPTSFGFQREIAECILAETETSYVRFVNDPDLTYRRD